MMNGIKQTGKRNVAHRTGEDIWGLGMVMFRDDTVGEVIQE